MLIPNDFLKKGWKFFLTFNYINSEFINIYVLHSGPYNKNPDFAGSIQHHVQFIYARGKTGKQDGHILG